MKQYYLIPVSEMDEIYQQCSSTKRSIETEKHENKALLDNPVLGNREKLQIYGSKLKTQKIEQPVDNEEHGTDFLNNYDYMQDALKYVPEKYKSDAFGMIKALLDKKIISMNVKGIVTLIETNDTCPISYFMGAVYKLKADVNRYEVFLLNISPHLVYIRNSKYINLIRKSADSSILDTSQQGGGIIEKKRKVLAWIEM